MFRFVQVLSIYIIIFTQMLDTSIANLALNNIAADIGIDVLHGSWIMTSYGIGLVISYPLGTMLSRYVSADSVFLAGGLLFSFASTGCGVTSDEWSFLVCRVVQGLGAGMTLVVAQPLMLRLLGEGSRTFTVSLWSSAISLAPVFGPLIGALTIETLSWRWLFYVNAPLVAANLLVLMKALKFSREVSKQSGRQFVTLAIFSVMVIASQYVFDFGEQLNWLDDAGIRSMIAVSCIFAAAFFLVNRRREFQIYDLTVFRDGRYAVGTVTLTVANAMVWSSVVILPIWLSTNYKMPVIYAGIIVSAGSGVAAVASPFVGKYLPVRYFGIAAVISLCVNGASFLMMSTFTTSSPHGYMILSRLVAGVALSIMTLPLLSLSLTNMSSFQIINANAISLTTRSLFANILVSVVFIAYRHLVMLNQADLVARMDSMSNSKYVAENVPAAVNAVSGQFASDALRIIFSVGGAIFMLSSVAVLALISGMRSARRATA